jgi:hypothetical protein
VWFTSLFSGPASFVASLIYRQLLLRWIDTRHQLRKPFLIASLSVLAMCGVEACLLATIGPVESRSLIGPLFEVVHRSLFLLGLPALATALALARSAGGGFTCSGHVGAFQAS